MSSFFLALLGLTLNTHFVQGYTSFQNGKYIGVYTDGEYITWYQAVKYCQNEIGTSLATIFNDVDNQQAIFAAQEATGHSIDMAWIGLIKKHGQDSFVLSHNSTNETQSIHICSKNPVHRQSDICGFIYLFNNQFKNSLNQTDCDKNDSIQAFVCNSPKTNSIGSVTRINNMHNIHEKEDNDCLWTGEWLNRDNPSGSGDWETLNGFRKDGINICNSNIPIDIKCFDVKTNISFNNYLFGNYVALHCSPKQGFLCLDDNDNRYDKCPDFKVQFCCPPHK